MALGVATILALAACSSAATDPEPTTTRPERVTTIAATTTLPLVAGCPGEGGFVEDGTIASFDQDQSDSIVIGRISWIADEACETFSFSFVTSEGAPATTPPTVTAAYVEGVPVIRLAVDADLTVITDQLVETPLIDRLYVVRSLERGSFIDLHLAAPAQARLQIGGSPARVTLDLQPGIVEYPKAATVSDLVVVMTPLDTEVVTPTIEVTGYTRTFESNVMIIATAGDQLVAEKNTTAAGSLDTWGEFRARVVLPPGEVSLFVGDENAENGGLEGVTISLTVR
jgi:Immunoglobulin-like domain of bacterial spore germination